MTTLSLAVIVPLYRGAEFLPQLVAELDAARQMFRSLGLPIELSEVIFVNDEAVDESGRVASELQKKYSWVRTVTLCRNFGQHAATIAGVLHSAGDWIATMDEDLQHRPCYLLSMLQEAVENSSDVVYASPTEGVHESWTRDFSSRSIKRVLGRLSGNPHVAKFNSFRMMRGSLARAAAASCTSETYFDVALTWFSGRIRNISLDLKDIRYIEKKASGYKLKDLLRHARRLAITTNLRILRVGALLGVASMAGALIFGTFVVLKKLINPESITVPGWASLMVAILFFCGLIAFLLGVILEFLSVLLLRIQGKPTFFVVDRSHDELLRTAFRQDCVRKQLKGALPVG